MKFKNYSALFSNKINLYITTTDYFWNDKKVNRHKKIQEVLKLEDKLFISPKQVHSDTVKIIKSNSELNPQCDSIIFEANSMLIGTINVADCVPICIYDFENEIISLVHSGWRGTLKNILTKTILNMIELGSRKDKLQIFLGPCIRGCCYQVDKNLSKKFHKSSVIKKNQKYFVDLIEQIKFNCDEIFIPRKNMFISAECTYDNNMYHSFRRDGNLSGRMTLIAYKN